MRPHRELSAGFTLVELLVVIGIIGLILATVLSAKPKTAATRVAVAARAIATTLQLARAQAMASNVETVVRIDTEKRQFGIAGSMHALPRGMTVAMTVAETERIEESGGVRFYPDGQSSGAEILLMLEGRASHIAVNWLTGEARLSR
jgi:general secretion pathway protein H